MKKSLVLLALMATSCAGWQKEAKTIDNAAIILCDVFFAPKHADLSIADVEAAFCSTAVQIAPFLATAKTAMQAGGAAREAH